MNETYDADFSIDVFVTSYIDSDKLIRLICCITQYVMKYGIYDTPFGSCNKNDT